MSSTAGRTRTRKSAADRAAEIRAAATDLARAEGLTALTLRAVAERAGVASSLIAHYQPSMDDLVAQVFADLVDAEVREVAALIGRAGSPADRLAALIGTLLDGTREDLTVVWVEAWALGRRNPALAGAVRAQMDAWHDLVRGLIDAGRAAGDFTTPSPSDAAWQLLGMIDGLNAQSLARGVEAEGYAAKMGRAAEILLGAPPGSIEPR